MTDVLLPTDLDHYRITARAWLAEHAPRYSGDNRQRRHLDADIALARQWQALKADHGYAAITLPGKYGGGGRGEIEQLIFTEEELHYDVPYEYFSISLGMPIPILERYGTDEQKQQHIPPAIRGEKIWCQMFSEPAAGSDLAALRLQARQGDDGNWTLNGQKLWTSWAHLSDYGIVIARSDPAVPKHAGLTFFFIDMRSPGITVRPILRMNEDSDVCEVFFDDVQVPDNQRLGNIGEGFRVAIETLMIERYNVSDETSGGPTLAKLLKIARSVGSNGHRPIDDGAVRQNIAEAFIQLEGLRSIHERAMVAIANGQDPGPEGSIRKLLLASQQQKLSAMAMDIIGASGLEVEDNARLTDSFTLCWLDSPALRIAGGTDEMLRNTIAERVLELPQDHRPDKGVAFNQIQMG